MLTIKILDVSDQPLNWDAADALAEGWTTGQALQWAKEHAKILTSRDIEKARLEEEKRLMEEKKTPQENTPDSAPQLTVASEQKPVLVSVPSEPQGNVIPMRAIEVREWMPPEFSEVDLALAWSADNPDWRYVNEWDKWYQWDGSRWAEDKKNSVTNIAQRKMIEAANWANAQNLTIGQKRSLCSKKTISNVVALAGSIPKHATSTDAFDADPFILGTPDGVIDLREGKIIEASRDHLITKLTAVSPQRGPMPNWDKVLDRCTMGDPDMRTYYQRWAGYMLTGDCREEAFLFVHGQGNSGKSKFVDCLGDLLGDYCATAKIETLMESKVERHTEEIACLAGARMVRTSEPEEGSRWNEALLKLLTGRDTVSARRLYEKQFTFRPQFKLVISGNFKPALKSTGEEIRRRMHFVEFPDPVPVEERIQNLPELLRAEWPAILQWAIDGCLEWQRCGLGKPDAVEEATKEYLSDEDTLGRWIEECCNNVTDARTLSGEAYKSYAAYVQSHGEGVTSQKRFVQRLEARGFGRIKSGGARYITGLLLGKEPQQTSYMDKYDDKF